MKTRKLYGVLFLCLICVMMCSGCTEKYMRYYYYGLDKATPTPTPVPTATPTPIPKKDDTRKVIAYSKVYGDVTYDLYEDMTAEVVSIAANISSCVIPEKIDEYRVIEVDNYAFSNCLTVTSLTFPVTVTELEMISLKETAWYINNTAEYLVVGDGILIKTNITKQDTIVPNGVKEIKDEGFKDNTIIMNVTLPGGLKNIGNLAFANCSNLQAINLPDGIEKIGISAFYQCISLKTIAIPSSVTEISDSAFSQCDKLSTVTINSGTTRIGSSAFWKCISLTSISMPNTVTRIGMLAFEGCTNLAKVELSSELVEIGERAFDNTVWFSGLTSEYVIVGKDSSILLKYNPVLTPTPTPRVAPTGTPNTTITIKVLNLPSGVNSVYSGFADDNYMINVVVLKEGIKSVGSFKQMKQIRSIQIPASAEWIDSEAFYGSSIQLVSFAQDSKLQRIGSYAFAESCLEEISLPISVTAIDEFAFNYCEKLSKVILKNGLKTIGEGAFRRCTALSQLVLPSTITTIGDYAFADCDKLVSINIPGVVYDSDALDTVARIVIGNSIFNNCTMLSKIVFEGNNVLLPTESNDNIFFGCANELVVYMLADSEIQKYVEELGITCQPMQ